MHLVKSGQSMTLNAWVTGMAKAKLSVIPNYIDGLTAKPERFNIDVKFKDYQQLAFKQQQALTIGHLISEDDDWVPALIRYQGDTYKVELRLKGDVSDHWRRADRWSYKINVKDGKTLFGMKRFAIQDPQTREYMNEWVIHRLQKSFGLIGLRYDFVDVTVNGKHLPVYALEENFEKRLIESNDRREGPILKYDSWFYWLGRTGLEPELAGSAVSTYQEGRYTGDAELSRLFDIARSLLEKYRRDEIPAVQVFDLRRMATLFALSDLTGYYHAIHIDNLKFYYNPVTSLIEPIGYDFNDIVPLSSRVGTVGEQIIPTLDDCRDKMDWRTGLFKDENFYLYYIDALQMISEVKFLDDFFESNRKDFDDALAILHSSYPWYNFNGEAVFRANQKYIRRLLNPEQSLQVYLATIDKEQSTATISVQNIYSLPAEIVALNIGGVDISLPESVIVPAYSAADPIRFTKVNFALTPENITSLEMIDKLKLVYRIYGTENLREEKIYPWSAVNEKVLETDFLRRLPNPATFSWLSIDSVGRTITFTPGEWTMSESLILPPGYVIQAGEGVRLDLVNSSMILSYSPLNWKGSEEYPIRIYSSDSTGQGVTVLSANSMSELSWTKFDNLTNPSQSAWSLTGAVTFYESPATISNCRFVGNHSEDGLNIVRTKFSIDHTSFIGTQADAFDADFCTGSFEFVDFIGCGNDGIDVSGSVITVRDVNIDGAGDKGLSAGENSSMTVSNTTIKNTEIAIASKDRSLVEIDNINLIDNRVAFAAYQKKPEFSHGEIRVRGLNMSGKESTNLIEQGSLLTIDGKVIPPSRENVKEILYGIEYGKSSK
jgi:hypothetical protein